LSRSEKRQDKARITTGDAYNLVGGERRSENVGETKRAGGVR